MSASASTRRKDALPLAARRHALIAEIERAMRLQCGFAPNGKLVVGVSGGPDSLALLVACAVLRDRESSAGAFQPIVVHVNHHLRASADEDARHVVAQRQAGLLHRLHDRFGVARLLHLALQLGHQPQVVVGERQPAQLRRLLSAWRSSPRAMRQASPTLVMAVLGQAKADRQISPEAESGLLANSLTDWALHKSLKGPESVTTLPGSIPQPQASSASFNSQPWRLP